MSKILTILEFIRVKQWIKNSFVAIPFVLSLKFLEFNFFNYFSLFIALASFCLISSSIYIINDICDIEEDKHHPKKKKRALPSGKISVFSAILIAAGFVTISLCLVKSFFNDWALLIMLFMFLTIFYTALKLSILRFLT